MDWFRDHWVDHLLNYVAHCRSSIHGWHSSDCLPASFLLQCHSLSHADTTLWYVGYGLPICTYVYATVLVSTQSTNMALQRHQYRRLSLGCHDKIPQSGWLHQQMFLTIPETRAHGQGVGRDAFFSGLWLVYRWRPFAVSSRGLFSAWAHIWSLNFSFFKDLSQIVWGPSLKTSF